MELQHSYVASRKVWRSLRVAFFIARKGIAAKRKLVMETYVKALRKYTHLIMLRKASCRSTARAPPAGQSFRLWERCDEHFLISDSPQSPTCNYFHPDADGSDEELHNKVSGSTFGSSVIETYSPGCTGDVDNVGAADEHERLAEEIDDRAEEFIRKFYEELRAQNHNYD